jgi:hypothetical protein
LFLFFSSLAMERINNQTQKKKPDMMFSYKAASSCAWMRYLRRCKASCSSCRCNRAKSTSSSTYGPQPRWGKVWLNIDDRWNLFVLNELFGEAIVME